MTKLKSDFNHLSNFYIYMLYFIVTDNISLLKVQMKLKEAMKKKFSSVYEGNGDNTSSLSSIYTELHITTGERESVENVFRQPEQKMKSCQSSKQQIINLNHV